MASIILSSIGRSVGNAILPGLGGRLLGSFTGKIGGMLDAKLGFSSSSAYDDGARLEDFTVQDSSYGVAIPVTYGTVRLAGNLIWASELTETSHETAVSGGKGGVISTAIGLTKTTYTYSLHAAIALCAGPIGGIQRIWADNEVIYEDGVWSSGVVSSATIHLGAQDQAVDPLLESWIGSGLTPAYRGVAYIVLESLQISNFGNRLPNLTFEILPPEATGNPTWLGDVNPDVSIKNSTNRQNGMPPLVVEGGDVMAKQILLGGYETDESGTRFIVTRYDVTGEASSLLQRSQSGDFTCSDVGSHGWAMAADGRYVAMGLQKALSAYEYFVCLYDAETNTFGSIITVTMLASEFRQIAWLDAFNFVVTDYRDGVRGVRVFMRSGLSIIDRGFYGVWGAATSTNHVPIAFTQFRAYGEGLLHYVGDVSLKFTKFYGCLLNWKNNALQVGTPFTVTSGYSLGTGSGPQVFLKQSGEDEWTLFYLTLIDMRMMSFVPTATGVTITRPWQKLTSANFLISNSNVPLIYGDRIVILHRSSAEMIYRVSEILLDDGCFTCLTDAAAVEDCDTPATDFNAARISSSRFIVMGNSSGSTNLGPLVTIQRHNTGDSLDHVVADLLERAGYESGDYDVTALAGVEVDGYTIAKQTTVAKALAVLQVLKPFDLVESSGQLKAVLRGQGESVTIAQEEGGAVLHGEAVSSTIYTQSRTQQLDLPRELTVDYLDASLDYETGSQRARRLMSQGATAFEKIVLPVVCTATCAKRIAQEQLYSFWYARDQYRLRLSRRWSFLSPGDVLAFGDLSLQVSSVVMEEGIVQIDALPALPSDFTSAATAESSSASKDSTLGASVASRAFLMDVPLLRSEDDQPGVYVAVSGLEGWYGATLWRASDGVNFERQSDFTIPAVAGIATSALASRSVYTMDKESTVTVQLLQGTLSSCSEADLLNGANVALLGGEILQFQTATLVQTGCYVLSNLLRGRRGTESNVSSHQAGEAFVVLSKTAVQFMPAQITDRGQSYHFRAVSSGGSLSMAADLLLSYQMKTLQPLPPVHLRSQRAGGIGSDVTFSWIRCARKNAAWVDYIDVPLDEDAELYDLEILNNGVVLRTISDVTTNSYVYTAAQQTADWGSSIPAQFSVRVYQRSARYGRGVAGE